MTDVGIDVQGELKRKEIAPSSRAPPSLPQPTPIHRPTSSRYRHMHRLSTGSAPIMAKGAAYSSPHLKTSPKSQVSSPTSVKSPVFGVQGGINLPHPSFQAQGQPQQQQPLQSQQLRSSTYPSISDAATRSGFQPIAPNLRNEARQNHWPSPFQTHNEQLGKYSSMLIMLPHHKRAKADHPYRTRIR